MFSHFKGKGVEIATFSLNKHLSEAELQQAAKQVETGLLSQEEGYLGYALLRGAANTYVHLTFADSQARAEQLCAKWVDSPHCQALLAAIEVGSAQMAFYQVINE